MLSEIPPEILVKILSFLPLSDVLYSSSVSTDFRSAAEIVYQNLRNRIRGEYGQSVSLLNFHDVQNLLFSKYGYAVGLWRIVSTDYGGIAEVKFDGFRLVGTRYFAPPGQEVDGSLRKKKLFMIDVDDQGLFECICFRGNNGSHKAEVSKFEQNGFQLDCKDASVHRHPSGPALEFDLFLCEELGIKKVEEIHRSDLNISKYEALSEECLLKCTPLVLPPHFETAVIQPGLFKGTYADHGIELVLLSYNDEDKSAVITKITGDSNVPAGQITVKPDLNENLDSEDKGHSNSLSLSSSGLPLRPFHLPDLIPLETEVVPEFYLHRFNSTGQVAFTGFTDPSFIEGEWVIFDNDTFGHLWLLLQSFSMFKRVTEKFSMC